MQLIIARLQECRLTQMTAIPPAAANQLPKNQPHQNLLRLQTQNPLNRALPKNRNLLPAHANPGKKAAVKDRGIMARNVSRKFSRNDKKLLEKERQRAAQKRTNRTMSYVGIAIAILLILSMIITTIRF